MADAKITLFLFLFFLSNSASLEQKISCNGTSNGTLCFQNETSACEYKKNLLTLADKNYLVWLHTSLRENMTKETSGKLPKAFFMKKLTWNDDLAKLAQKWAEKCKPTKEPPPLFGDQPISQLILTTDEKTGKNLKNALSKWTEGFKHLNPAIISQYKSPSLQSDYGPVAQILWWNTTLFGCGRSTYYVKNCESKTKNCGMTQLVCNYFPAGNKEGEPIYITTNVNNLICQHNEESVHCKVLGDTKSSENATEKFPKRKRGKIDNRIMNRMLEVWPAAAGASAVWCRWDVNFFYIIFFSSIFTIYNNVLHVNLRAE